MWIKEVDLGLQERPADAKEDCCSVGKKTFHSMINDCVEQRLQYERPCGTAPPDVIFR